MSYAAKDLPAEQRYSAIEFLRVNARIFVVQVGVRHVVVFVTQNERGSRRQSDVNSAARRNREVELRTAVGEHFAGEIKKSSCHFEERPQSRTRPKINLGSHRAQAASVHPVHSARLSLFRRSQSVVMQEGRRKHVDAITDDKMPATCEDGSPHQSDRHELPAPRDSDYIAVGEISAGPDRIFGAGCSFLRSQSRRTETDENQQNKVLDDDFSSRSFTGTVF